MPQHTPLIATIVVGLVLAFALGAVAIRLRISPIVGYLLAGVAVGPYTPGFVADQALAAELAEIGVILLMFGVGLHFSPKELLSVRGIAIPGAIAQMAIATTLGLGLTLVLGWSTGRRAPESSSAWPSRLLAPLFCCAPSTSATCSTATRDGSRWVGLSSRTWRWSWSWCCCRR
jgi:Kef-type K+ transport system membrane component KefB